MKIRGQESSSQQVHRTKFGEAATAEKNRTVRQAGKGGAGGTDRVERGEERVEPRPRGDGVVHALGGDESQVQRRRPRPHHGDGVLDGHEEQEAAREERRERVPPQDPATPAAEHHSGHRPHVPSPPPAAAAPIAPFSEAAPSPLGREFFFV